MRIAFLTGSLEPGRDGVGDYTIGLAEELQQKGHDVIVIALRDKFMGEDICAERRIAVGSIQRLRLPSGLRWAKCLQRAGKLLDRFDPEWVSLQFVSYSFHHKGLVHSLAGKLGPLLRGRKMHLMFHEIWLCKELAWGWKQCVVGAFQRFFIQRFVHKTKPDVVHTSNATYGALLSRSGIPATVLGLFGNVPIPFEPTTAWIESQLRTALGAGYRRETLWLFGFFGALHPQWPPEPLLTHLLRASRVSKRKPVLLSIGRIGTVGEELWNRMAKAYANRFGFLRLGEQPTERVSEYLSFLDCGIATTPRSIIGKSGTVTAMMEHGLPVIVNREDAPGVKTEVEKSEPLLIPCDKHLESRLQAGLTKGRPLSRRAQIAKEFLCALPTVNKPEFA